MKIVFVCKSTTWVPVLAGVAALLSACGQYGNLYLPEDTPAAQAQQPQLEEPQDKDNALEQEQEVEQQQQREVEQPQDL